MAESKKALSKQVTPVVLSYDEAYTKMVRDLAKSGDDIIKTLTPEKAHMLHMAVGISGEIGEILKCVTRGLGMENLIEESGDTEFYLEGITLFTDLVMPEGRCNINGTTPTDFAVEASIAASDVIDAVKKSAIYGKDLAEEKLIAALQELVSALASLYNVTGTSRVGVRAANVVKLLTGKKHVMHLVLIQISKQATALIKMALRISFANLST